MKGPEPVPVRYSVLGLFFFLLGVSLLLFHGQLKTSDEQLMAATTVSIVEDQSLVFPQEIYGQRFTGYGMGTPLAGVPAYLADKLLAVFGLTNPPFTLIPLTNAVLFALIGLMVAAMLEGPRRWAAVVVVLGASPLLPVSLTFYSEMLTAAGLLAVTLAAWRSPAGAPAGRMIALAAAGAAAAVLARTAALPLVFLVLAWGWRLGTERKVLLGGLAGSIAAVCLWLIQNRLLRGGFLMTGYEGQSFTTPLLTGLHGLLFSPERGLLVFYPVLAILPLYWRFLGGRLRALTTLAAGMLLFSLVFHARFWTWHGGWTFGPRFLLPALVLLFPSVASLITRGRELGSPLRTLLWLSLLWSALLAYAYSAHSAMDWWNKAWPFHQVENQWLFMPQLSLWQQWFEGIPLSSPHEVIGLERLIFAGLGFAFCLVASYPLLQGWRGYSGNDPEARDELSRIAGYRMRSTTAFVLAGVLLLYGVVPMLRGPRGWHLEDAVKVSQAPDYMLLGASGGTFQGLIDYPLNGKLKLWVRANARYRVEVDYKPVFEQMEDRAPHLAQAEVEMTPGLKFIQVQVYPNTRDSHFQMYWTWGGEGIYLSPAGGEYLLPRELNTVERIATKIWRRRFIITSGILALLLLFFSLPAPRTRKEAGLS